MRRNYLVMGQSCRISSNGSRGSWILHKPGRDGLAGVLE